MADDIQIRMQVQADDLVANTAKAESALKKLSDTVQGTTASLSPLNAATAQVIQQYDRGASTLTKAQNAFQHVSEALAANEISGTQASRMFGMIAQEAEGASESTGHFSLASAGATREIIVLGHEMVSGNFSRLPGSLMVLAERMGGLSLTAMGAAGAVAALGYGIYELIEHAQLASAAIDEIRGTMAQMGNSAQYSTTSAKQALRDLVDNFNIGTKAAGDVKSAIERIPSATPAVKTALTDLGTAWVQMGANGGASDDQVVKGLDSIAKVAAGGASTIRSFLAANQMLTVEYAKELDGAQQFNDALKAQGVLVQALQARVGDYSDQLKAFNQQEGADVPLMGSWSTVPKQKKPKPTEHAGDAADEGDLQQYLNQDQIPAQTREVIQQVTAEWTGGKAELDATVAEMWQNVVDQTNTSGKTLTSLNQESLNAQRQARQSAAQDAIAEERLKVSQMEASGTASREQTLTAEIASSQRLLANSNLTADERRSVETQLNAQLGQLHAQQAATALTSVQEMVQGARAGSQQRIQLAEQEVETARQLYGEESSEYRKALSDKRTAEREYSKEKQTIARQDAEADLAISKIELTTNKQLLDEGVAEGAITAQQKIEILRGFTEASYQEDLKRLQDELATLDSTTKEYDRVYNEIRKLKAQNNAELAQLDRQASETTKQEAEKATKAWEQGLAPLSNGISSSIQGMIMGTQTLKQAETRLAQSMLASVVDSAQKAVFHWAAAELAKTTATKSGVAQREAAETTGDTSFLGTIGAKLASWLGLETGKTAATTAGVTARTTAETAGAVETKATTTETAVSSIGSKAADAAAGAFDAMAGIPIIGPILGAAAAATTFAAVMAYQAIASAEGGWGQVPYDGAMTMLHKNEMVLPASIATPMRAALQGGSFSQTSNSSVSSNTSSATSQHLVVSPTYNITSPDAASVSNLIQRNGPALTKALQRQIANGARLVKGRG